MYRYCQPFLRLVEAEPDSDVGHALEREFDDLALLVHKKLEDPEQARWRLPALADIEPHIVR